MKKSSIANLEKLMNQMQVELEALKMQPVLTKEEAQRIVRKKKREFTQFTKLVREKIFEKNESFDRIAKNLKISRHFVRHILYTDTVPISPRLVDAISSKYGIEKKKLTSLAAERNEIANGYYKSRRSA